MGSKKNTTQRTAVEFLEKLKRKLQADISVPRSVVALLIILVAATDLRIQSVEYSEVINPVRADARDYFSYAYNLKHFGVYSRTDTLTQDPTAPPKPDALRTPAYPLFLLPFVDGPPTSEGLLTITRVQALLSVITVLLAFGLARQIVSTWYALAAAALTALSPHLVTMNIYLLSETLFGFLTILAVLLVCAMPKFRNLWLPVGAGATLAVAGLAHPMLLYFIIPLIVFVLVFWGWKKEFRRTAVLLLAFFLVSGTWIGRNIATLGISGDNTLALAALRVGVYRDYMFQDRPETYAYPYRFDPRYEETSKDFGVVTREIVDQIAVNPMAQIGWYLKKPVQAWRWNMAEGPGDIFIYPVADSPYRFLWHFRTTRTVMYWLHWPLVVLMVVGLLLAWLPSRLSRLPDSAIFGARVISLLLLYHAALMMVGFPLPRYTVPLRPFLYIISMVPIALVVQRFIAMRSPPAPVRRRHASKRK